MDLKAADRAREEEAVRREEAQRAYDEELQAMLDKANNPPEPRVRSL